MIRLQYSPSALQVSYTSMASSLQAGPGRWPGNGRQVSGWQVCRQGHAGGTRASRSRETSGKLSAQHIGQGLMLAGWHMRHLQADPEPASEAPVRRQQGRDRIGGVPQRPAVHSRLGCPHGLQGVVCLAAVGGPRVVDNSAVIQISTVHTSGSEHRRCNVWQQRRVEEQV